MKTKLAFAIFAMVMVATGSAMAQWAQEPMDDLKTLQQCRASFKNVCAPCASVFASGQLSATCTMEKAQACGEVYTGICGQTAKAAATTSPSVPPKCDDRCRERRKARQEKWNALFLDMADLKVRVAALERRADENDTRDAANAAHDSDQDNLIAGLRKDVDGLLDCHGENPKAGCHQAIEEQIDEAKKEAMDYTDMMFISTAFKFDLGAVVLGSTDFRGVGIIAGGLRIALDFGATDRFRPVFHASVGGGHGRWANVVWEVGTSQEIRVNDKGTVWLGPAVTWSHENVLDANYNTFLGLGLSLRVLFPESHHGYFTAAVFGGDNMYFVPDKTGEYDEVMAHHFGIGIQLSVGYSIFQDLRKK